jgi:hypothetical protein
MEPLARAVRKSSGLNIESGELALARSRESDHLAHLGEPFMTTGGTSAANSVFGVRSE